MEHKQAALEYRQEHIDCGELTIHGSGGLLRVEDYESWLKKITDAQTAAQTGWVNCSTYFAFVDVYGSEYLSMFYTIVVVQSPDFVSAYDNRQSSVGIRSIAKLTRTVKP